MLRRIYLLFYTAIGITLAVSVHAEPKAGAGLRQPQTTASPQESATRREPPISPLLERIARATEAEIAHTNPQQQPKYAADYLQTQETMAGNSSRMIWFVIVDLALTAIGLLLIAATVYFTRKAANAATNTLSVITKNGQRELRAYLSIEPEGITKPPGKADEGHGLVKIHYVGKHPRTESPLWFTQCSRRKGGPRNFRLRVITSL